MLIGSNKFEFGLFAALIGYDSILLGTGNLAGLPMAMVDMLYTCSNLVAAKSRSKAGVNTWRYNYAGDFPNMNMTLEEGTGGSWHGAEVGLVFGTTELVSKTPDTVEEKKMSKQMREFWTTFAKDPDHGLSNLGWPVFNPDRKSSPLHSFLELFEDSRIIITLLFPIVSSLRVLGRDSPEPRGRSGNTAGFVDINEKQTSSDEDICNDW